MNTNTATKTLVRLYRTILLGAVTGLTGLLASLSSQAREITVPSGSISTIQQAIDAAAPADTITVKAGSYDSFGIGPDKPGLRLRAAGPPGAVRVAGSGWLGIWIDANNVRVEGFCVSGFGAGIEVAPVHGVQIIGNMIGDLTGAYPPGILIGARGRCSDLAVGQNTLFGHLYHGILVQGGCSNIHIYGTTLTDPAIVESVIQISGSAGCEVDHNSLDCDSWFGVWLNENLATIPGTSSGHYIHHNFCGNHTSDGIFLWESPNCALEHNVCDNNQGNGISLASSPQATVTQNKASGNTESGIGVGESPNCQVSYNQANQNAYGIAVGGSCGTAFDFNSAAGNHQFDFFAPDWETPASCNTYLDNHGGTAVPSLDVWHVK